MTGADSYFSYVSQDAHPAADLNAESYSYWFG